MFFFSENKLYPLVESIDLFVVEHPGFPIDFTVTFLEISENFPLFCIDPPENPRFFFKFGMSPGISIDVLNKSLRIFFLEKPNGKKLSIY